MNDEEGFILLNKVSDINMIDAIKEAIENGLSIYKDSLQGIDRLTEWQKTAIESRIFTASIFSALETYKWTEYGFSAVNEVQHTSKRCCLESEYAIIDIIKEFPTNLKYVQERAKLNNSSGLNGKRYILVEYKINKNKNKISSLRLIVPKNSEHILAEISSL